MQTVIDGASVYGNGCVPAPNSHPLTTVPETMVATVQQVPGVAHVVMASPAPAPAGSLGSAAASARALEMESGTMILYPRSNVQSHLPPSCVPQNEVLPATVGKLLKDAFEYDTFHHSQEEWCTDIMTDPVTHAFSEDMARSFRLTIDDSTTTILHLTSTQAAIAN